MANPIGRLPTSEPIESKLVNMLWLNDNIVAAPVSRDKNVAPPAKGLMLNILLYVFLKYFHKIKKINRKCYLFLVWFEN